VLSMFTYFFCARPGLSGFSAPHSFCYIVRLDVSSDFSGVFLRDPCCACICMLSFLTFALRTLTLSCCDSDVTLCHIGGQNQCFGNKGDDELAGA